MREVLNIRGAQLRRPIRRILVIAMYAAFAVFIAALYAANGSFTPPLVALAIGGGLAAVYAWLRLLRAPGYVGDTADSQLDERQRLVRDRAYHHAYLILVLLFVVVALVAMLSSGNESEWAGLRLAGRFLPWFAFVAGTLPTAVIAWSEADEAEDVLTSSAPGQH